MNKFTTLLLLALGLAVTGCQTVKPVNAPDLSAISGGVAAASKMVSMAKAISQESKKTLNDVAKTGAKPNDPRVLKLQADNETLNASLAEALDNLAVVNTRLVVAQKEVVKVTKERNDFQRKNVRLLTLFSKASILISLLAVGCFVAGHVFINLYSKQVTGFIPILGDLASNILGYIGGGIATAIFIFVLYLVQGPLGWMVTWFL